MAGQWGNADYVLRDRNEVKIRESIQDENSGWAFFVFKDVFFAGRGGLVFFAGRGGWCCLWVWWGCWFGVMDEVGCFI